ncbi:uncharacterized protein RSE6_11074 [Rhynchosporium secalis]|uniref:U4/U6.U5 small nuclear ribonucleoprotein 27kDa protein domain-containing protein n=1 Tax=Rhynchosporium secalis TaxID=38038 RepID=A0A1E1MM29_RHYSE|nr:uncharacterized protein RSE6_11074 [Rhynchosporium secalis]
MAEPPYKRARRPDSKQMWDEADRRAPQAVMPSRERDDRGGDRREDRNRDRDRRYRSRSPRDSRGAGGGRDSAGRRDERERDTREGGSERGGRREYRDRERGMYPVDTTVFCHREKPNMSPQDGPSGRARDGGKDNDTRERNRRDKGKCLTADTKETVFSFRIRPDDSQDGEREGRDRPRERSKDRPRDSDRYPRSRSPRRERERDSRKEVDVDKNTPKPYHDEEEYIKARTATPPVSFRVSNTAYGQDDEHMEVDEETKPAKKGKKGKKVAKPVEDDDDLIVEDDGMAAMQAMMGFGGFGTTHQQKVAGNDIYAVRKEKKTEYRQYMNRVGGFNRPLSPSRES